MQLNETPTVADDHDSAYSIDDAITSRHSVRAFTSREVSRVQVEHLLNVAKHAPSATNTQPWQVHVLGGDTRAALCAAILARFHGEVAWQAKPDYDYYPSEWAEPYLARRRACGWGLYGALGIAKGERAKTHAQHARNFVFFDAPIGLIFTVDRRFKLGAWLDVGMFMQNIMIAARGLGLHTCPQAAFADYAPAIRDALAVPTEQIIICGMAIGYKDPAAPENRWRTEREPLESFVNWHGI